MKQLFSLLAVVLFSASLMACGGGECGKVKDVCAECEGLQKTICETAAAILEDANDEDACKKWNEAGSAGACSSGS